MKNGQYFNKFNWKTLKNDSDVKLTTGQRITVDKIIKAIELGQRQGVRSLWGGGNRPPIFVPVKSPTGTNLTNAEIQNFMKQRKINKNRLDQAYFKLTGHGVPPSLLKTLGISVLLATGTSLGGRAAMGPRNSTLPVVAQPQYQRNNRGRIIVGPGFQGNFGFQTA